MENTKNIMKSPSYKIQSCYTPYNFFFFWFLLKYAKKELNHSTMLHVYIMCMIVSFFFEFKVTIIEIQFLNRSWQILSDLQLKLGDSLIEFLLAASSIIICSIIICCTKENNILAWVFSR